MVEINSQSTIELMTEDKNFKYLVRVANTDLDGKKSLIYALTKIKGISIMYANAICALTKLDPNQKTGYLNEEQIAKLTEQVKRTDNIPKWMKNRQKDYTTGQDKHLIDADLVFAQDNDLKLLKMIKSYKGLRHQVGLPVRGQRTKSNFRKNKTTRSKKKKRGGD